MARSSSNTTLKQKVVELEAQVEKLQKELDKKQQQKNSKILDFFRRSAIVLLVILTALFINLSIIALYVRSNVVNTDVWVDKTTQIIKTPSVSNDISKGLAKVIFEKSDVKASIQQILPEKVAPLAVPLTNTLQNYTATEIDKILQSDQFIQFWQNASRSAHSGIVQSLEAANGNKQVPTDTLLYIKDENMYLNLQPVLDNFKTRLADRGLSFVNSINLQGVNKSVEIAHINNFQSVLAAFNAINKVAILMPILALVSAIGAIVLSRGKRLAIMSIAGLTVLLMMLNVQAIYFAKYPFVSAVNSALASSTNSSAQAIYQTFTSNLVLFNRLVMATMLFVILVAYITGPFKFAKWLRRSVANMFKGKLDYKATRWLGKNAVPVVCISGVITALLLVFPIVNGAVYSITIVVLDIIFTLIVLSFRQKK